MSGPTARRAHRAPQTLHLRGSLPGVLPGRRGTPRHRAVPAQAPQRPQIRVSPGPIGLLLAGVVLVAGSGALGSLGLTSGTTGTTGVKRPAGALATPVPSVAQPTAIEAPAPYLPQVSCNPVAMPGAVALGDLLRATYPGTSYGIPRACGTDGMASEHYEGRAVDWFTSVRDTTGAARAATLLNWLLATDPAGHAFANARRLGVMYLIWNNKIWGSYRAAEGWRPYSNCATHPERAYDTTCHRDHIHISMSWAGAMRRTSFWTGRVAPVDYGPCRPADLNWAAPYTGPRAVPCPPHPTVIAPAKAPSVAAGLYAASGAQLGPGSTGPLVTALQRGLHVAADGSFGPMTGSAVSAFRVAHKLRAGQVVDAATWRALLAAMATGAGTTPTPTPTPAPAPKPAPTPAPPVPAGPLAPYVKLVLTYDDSGPGVTAVQRLLGVTPSGWFGPRTLAAVRAFQAKNKIPTTGNVGPLTWAALTKLALHGGTW